MAMIAAEAGVSKNTVSLALRGDRQIPPVTRRRIARIAERLGYVKNPVLAHLMTELRKAHPAGFRQTLGLLNANLDREAFARHPTIPAYVQGCRRRAEAQGYGLDEFWLHDPGMDGLRLNRILKSRGIRGVIVVGLMKTNELPHAFLPVWEQNACVVTGVRTRNPTLSFCCVDHHALVLEACGRALALGYERPALVIDRRIDRLVDGRFSAGMSVAQQALPARRRVPGFYDVDEAREEPAVFKAWFERHRPDVILTLYTAVRRWLQALGVGAPRDIGLVQLERRRGNLEWAGMDQHNDLTGEAAVDLLVSLLHNNQAGLPAFPVATLVSGSWVDGGTVRQAVKG
ncbi:MAG: LacI family transcriptional regulator [Rariglobus sp.]|nr:LacI family transcriptional regulator [Rariglobus sp.]